MSSLAPIIDMKASLAPPPPPPAHPTCIQAAPPLIPDCARLPPTFPRGGEPPDLGTPACLMVLPPPMVLQVANLAGEEIPQIYAACGRGARSTLRVLRPGLAVTGATPGCQSSAAPPGLEWEIGRASCRERVSSPV